MEYIAAVTVNGLTCEVCVYRHSAYYVKLMCTYIQLDNACIDI